MNVAGGHMIKARVLQVDKRKVTLDTGMKLAKIAVSDITPDCILERASAEAGGFPSADGEQHAQCPFCYELPRA